MQYSLRPALESDRDWVYALKSEAYRDVSERQFGPWDENFQRERFLQRWNPGNARLILSEGQPVGLVATTICAGNLWIDEIQLIPAWRNRGLGATVLRDLIASARRESKEVRLQVLKENYRAKHLYEKLGFTTTEQNDTHYIMQHRQTRVN